MIDMQPDTNLPVIREVRPAPELGAAGQWPNDLYFPQQWALKLIHAPEAWALAEELGVKSQPLLAIVDTEMLPPALYAPELNVVGLWNTYQNVPYHVTPPTCTHAIHCASIAASATNNGLGMAGVSWGPPILGVQVLFGCSGTQTKCAAGIDYAREHGARIISMSLQYGTNPETVMVEACAKAEAEGIFVVAASGNYGSLTQLAVPSMLPTVVGVGAVRQNLTRPKFSNAGPDLELCAPGEYVLGMTAFGYSEWSGTSMACPHVAGAAALLMSVYPDLKGHDVRAILNATATDLGAPGRDDLFGFGMVNVYKALHAADPCYPDFDHDGTLSVADFGAFQAGFAAGKYRADCNADGAWTISDFGCFQAAFVGGCR